MKKFAIIAFAALLVVVFTMPAAALENVFGGYWRTRFYTNQDFSGNDKETDDWTVVDTRTRLYYTAVLNDELKLVNKFEMDAVWGGNDASKTGSKGGNSYADIGADGVNLEIKNSYADFNYQQFNVKVGVQGLAVARGFLFDDDFGGAVVTFKGDGFSLPFVWIKSYEGGQANNNKDFDYYAISPSFTAGEGTSINPFVLYATSGNASGWGEAGKSIFKGIEDANIYFAGINVDLNMDPVSFWATGIYEGGDLEDPAGKTTDIKAWLAAAGFSIGLNFGDVHGQAFYATGQDPDDKDVTYFVVPAGQSYYWSEIMGYGDFDQIASNNAPADQISNVMAANIGTTIKPNEDLSVSLDVWYAALAEDMYIAAKNEKVNDLGIEVDLKISYKLVEGLTLDVVGAYLFAGDATTEGVSNDANPFEVGSRLSLSF